MRYTVIFIACLLSALFAASSAATIVASGLLTYNGLVVTSHGDGQQVSLESIGVCNPLQEWALDSDGYIYQKSNTTQVLDVQNSNTRNGNPVIMWIRKTPAAPNQLWTLNSDGITTQLNSFNLRRSSTSNLVIISNNMPIQKFEFTPIPENCPVTCTSHGDPHFTSWNARRFDFQSANTVLLANYSGNRVYAVQTPCAPGVTCNEGFVVHPAGTNETFQVTYQQAWHNRQMTTLPMGMTNYSAYINVTKFSNTVYQINIPGGYISYAAYTWYYGYYINLGVTITAPGYIGNCLCAGPPTPQNPAHAFGSQFLVKNRNETDYQYAVTAFSYNPNYQPNYGPYTTDDTALLQRITTACSVLTSASGPFAACQALVPSDYYYGTCVNDSIALNNVAVAQQSIDAYAFLCNEAAKKNGTTITFPTSSVTTIVVGANATVRVGASYTFIIIAKDITNKNRTTGGDSFTITSTGPSTLVFSITDNSDGTYTVTTSTSMEGIYIIYVKLNNVSDITGSPLNVTSVAATSAVTTGLVFVVTSGQTASFTIQARTSSGSNRTGGGDQFSVTFSGGNFQLLGVTDNNDGTYTVTYIPSTVGTYTINVMYQNSPIACSPYTVIVR